MTLTLTADQLAEMQAYLDIGNAELVIPNSMLNYLYDKMAGDFNKAMVLALLQLKAKAVKLYNTTVGDVTNNKAVVFDHLDKLLVDWKKLAGLSGGKIKMGRILLNIDEPLEFDLQTNEDLP